MTGVEVIHGVMILLLGVVLFGALISSHDLWSKSVEDVRRDLENERKQQMKDLINSHVRKARGRSTAVIWLLRVFN